MIKFISEDKKYIDEIVSIENKNSISPKFLLDYDGDINNLNNFLKNNFINFCNKNEEYYNEILNDNKKMEYCYKIDLINKLEGQIETVQEKPEIKNNLLGQLDKGRDTEKNT